MNLNFKEFKPSSWAIDNKTSIYILTALLTLAGYFSYQSLPKEQFPEVVLPQIIVNTIYPGTSPKNIEDLVTKHVEKQVKAIVGVKKVTSSSQQDISTVTVEFNTNVKISDAKQRVKDAVDKARSELPTDLPADPQVIDIDLSQLPILYVNVSGNYDLARLKQYSDVLKDRIEGLKEITRVDMVGALDREIQVNLDQYKMAAASVTFNDVAMALKYENMNISGGSIAVGGMKRNLAIAGQFTDVSQIQKLVIRSMSGATVYLKDIADVKDAAKEQESFARLEGKNVITLNVIKRSGENLISASDKIRAEIKDLETSVFPKDLKIVITGDQASGTRVTLHDLINTIIIGFIFVTLILMFFMGTTNALFVAFSVPLSMCIAFLVIQTLGFTMNLVVLFAFLLALGIVVDDAIVVIENTHRIFHHENLSIKDAAKKAAGEVFAPVLSGTLTTLAPFIPLAFWEGVIGEFMFYLPITLIIALLASLVVAYIINPVFAVDFMQDEHKAIDKQLENRQFKRTIVGFGIAALLGYVTSFGLGNIIVTLFGFYLLNKYFFVHLIRRFQTKTWPSVQNAYARLLAYCLTGYKPFGVLFLTLCLLVFSVFLMGLRQPKVVFFPQGDPNFVYTYIKLPIGTNQLYTDSITRIVEQKIYGVIGKNNPIVESVIANVAVGAGDPNQPAFGAESNKGKVTVAFVEFAKRNGASTAEMLNKIRDNVKGIAGTEITVEQESGGPPTGKPISIEISGDNFEDLAKTATNLKQYLGEQGIAGIEELKSDLVTNKPEITIDIDREAANREGISTAQIGLEIRNAVFGNEASKYRDSKDDYPIQIRFKADQRNDLERLINTPITYRDMNFGGMMRSIPISSLAKISYTNTYGGINRKNQKRTATLSSNVLGAYNPNEVVANIEKAMLSFDAPAGVNIKMGGQQEEQAETSAFLGLAMLASLGLIFIILVTQFNSLSKTLLILSEIIFSVIGVLLGLSIFGMEISIVMTGIGIVALVGIVVRNGILLVEFTDVLYEKEEKPLKVALIEAGRIRMTPVLLTATATILGLVPLAVGLNIDFWKLFTEFKPHIFFGGDSVAFWGPLSWTMIFGLSFATIITLILVPVLYYLNEKMQQKLFK